MYPFKEIEPKWQKEWADQNVFEAKIDKSKPKYYVLDMFPYPSGSGLHVGHVEGYTASDIVSRYKRLKGFNVLHPMGWDAFGLPAEQHAIQTGVHPAETTKSAISNFKRQLNMLGFSYDWSREISTADPAYYKWTQWIFEILHKKGLAYQKEMPVNWCPALRTVLANEEVVDGKSERGGHPVEKRMMKQWMLKITAYAEKLLKDLDDNDWHERTKEGQRNWIGKSVGLKGFFQVENSDHKFEIFTTRPDTIFGVTFMVVAPEHPLVAELTTANHKKTVEDYQKQAAAKLDVERQSDTNKTGVFTGSYAINPVNGKKIPIWISDYVLMDYGTGAIMAVPGHDERDFEFAKKFDLEIIRVLDGKEDLPSGDGPCVNSDFINGLNKDDAIHKVVAWFEDKGLGEKCIQYKLRDWLFSRQRYWGEPFPVYFSEKGDVNLVGEKELPVTLPEISDYKPTESGEAPLAKAPEDWLSYQGGRRETDTMPGSAGSSWYFLRYCDPKNEEEFCSKEAQDYWMPVDLYLGGAEHTVGHLLYSRFWQKVLNDEGHTLHKEPFQRLVHQGMILGEDGEKMSKSRGNVVNPDDVVEAYGADALRVYEMFMGPLERDKPWNQNGLVGVFKFLSKIWRATHNDKGEFVVVDEAPSDALLKLTHQTIKKVSSDMERLSFNTAVSQLMILINEITKSGVAPRFCVEKLTVLLSPFAPHMAEEIWHKLGNKTLLSKEACWPDFDEALAKDDLVTIAIQVMGKVRGKIEVDADSDQDTVMEKAMQIDNVKSRLDEAGGPIKKVIFVKNRILNLIV